MGFFAWQKFFSEKNAAFSLCYAKPVVVKVKRNTCIVMSKKSIVCTFYHTKKCYADAELFAIKKYRKCLQAVADSKLVIICAKHRNCAFMQRCTHTQLAWIPIRGRPVWDGLHLTCFFSKNGLFLNLFAPKHAMQSIQRKQWIKSLFIAHH